MPTTTKPRPVSPRRRAEQARRELAEAAARKAAEALFGIGADDGDIEHFDEFSGIGGWSEAGRFVRGVRVADAANHDPEAIEEHRRNFPHATHWEDDITKTDITTIPPRLLFTNSPSCPGWTNARGMKRDFDRANAVQSAMFEMPGAKPADPALLRKIEAHKRSRLLMEEVVRYLRSCVERGKPVMIGVTENVIQCRQWDEWDRWLGEIRALGYKVRVIAFSSMHARPERAPYAPQSRDRLYVAYWHESLGRDPDWDKWLRPTAFCEGCCETVWAVQVFKDPRNDMGCYGPQYIYQCPNTRCRREVFPAVVPALAAIDLSKPIVSIGDRPKFKKRRLEDTTIARIDAGMRKHWAPLLVPTGGTWRANGVQGAQPLVQPAPTLTTRETDGIAPPPLMVPVEARAEATRCGTATDPVRTLTTRLETAVALPPVLPFITPMRGGGSTLASYSVTDPAGTVSAQGNHHGLVLPPTGVQPLLVPYYGNCDAAIPASSPCGTLTTRDRYGLATAAGEWLTELPAIEDVLFRMLEPDEIGRLMGFGAHFLNLARTRRSQVRLYGNAITPPVGEVILSALVECLTGEQFERNNLVLTA